MPTQRTSECHHCLSHAYNSTPHKHFVGLQGYDPSNKALVTRNDEAGQVSIAVQIKRWSGLCSPGPTQVAYDIVLCCFAFLLQARLLVRTGRAATCNFMGAGGRG